MFIYHSVLYHNDNEIFFTIKIRGEKIRPDNGVKERETYVSYLFDKKKKLLVHQNGNAAVHMRIVILYIIKKEKCFFLRFSKFTHTHTHTTQYTDT